MSEADCHTSGAEGKERNWERVATAAHLHEYEGAREAGMSQREFSEQAGIPRSTLQHWLERKVGIDESPAVVAFFESPEGLAILHRVVLAAQFVIPLAGAGGIRTVCKFLELSGLDSFVAASFGSQQQAIREMEQAVVDFGQEEKGRLAEGMPHKSITTCMDETFHPETCLVAIEPASNFILLEQYSPKRDAAAWTTAMNEAIDGLDVDVVQSTSDEALGILRCVRESFGAHHSPDIFHVQQEATRGTAGTLGARVRQADKNREEAEKRVVQLFDEWEDFGAGPIASGGPTDYEDLADEAVAEYEEAVAAGDAAQQRQQQAREAIRGISESYHPFDLNTGAPRQADEVSADLDARFQSLDEVASEASLSERCRQRIAKARRVVKQLIATIAFYHHFVWVCVEDLGLPEDAERVVHRHLIPGLYVQLVAGKAGKAETRAALREQAALILSPVRDPSSPLFLLDDDERATVDQVALDCAQFFQRSSSCVEGRNGQLALHHHGLHRLLPRKLSALTVVHNYFITRPDGTTAAERFFAQKPRNLFDVLLDKLAVPRRPAATRRTAA